MFLITPNSKNDRNNKEQNGRIWNYSFNYAQLELLHMREHVIEFPIRYKAD